MPATAAAPSLHVSRSAERVLSLLDTVISSGPLTLAEAARRVDLPASTALRHLRVLESHGYLRRSADGEYEAGPAFVRLALGALSESPTARLIDTARPFLDALAAATGESSYLAVRENDSAVYLATTESDRAIRHVGWVGRRVPMRGTAVGAALTGHSPDPHVNTGAAEPDVTAVAASVTTDGDSVVAALCVLGPAHRLEGDARDRTVAATADAARSMSEELRSNP